jgi:hypothetical protein
MAKQLIQEAQPQVSLLVAGIEPDALLGIGEPEPIVLTFDLREGAIGIVDGQIIFGEVAVGSCRDDGLGVRVNRLSKVELF